MLRRGGLAVFGEVVMDLLARRLAGGAILITASDLAFIRFKWRLIRLFAACSFTLPMARHVLNFLVDIPLAFFKLSFTRPNAPIFVSSVSISPSHFCFPLSPDTPHFSDKRDTLQRVQTLCRED